MIDTLSTYGLVALALIAAFVASSIILTVGHQCSGALALAPAAF